MFSLKIMILKIETFELFYCFKLYFILFWYCDDMIIITIIIYQ